MSWENVNSYSTRRKLKIQMKNERGESSKRTAAREKLIEKYLCYAN